MRNLAVPLMLLALCSCGGSAPTRVTVENQAPEAVTVDIRSADGEEVLSFSEVPAGGEGLYEEVPFDDLTDVQVVVVVGEAIEGSVTLEAHKDNAVVVSNTEAPEVLVFTPIDTGGGGFW